MNEIPKDEALAAVQRMRDAYERVVEESAIAMALADVKPALAEPMIAVLKNVDLDAINAELSIVAREPSVGITTTRIAAITLKLDRATEAARFLRSGVI